MKRMRAVLIFPPTVVEKPITYRLIKDFGLRVNIIRASIDPGKQGKMVVDIEGATIDLSHGQNFLESEGITVEPLNKEIRHMEERCTSCTACIPHCPTDALVVDRDSWTVSFVGAECVICLSCVEVCVYGAMSVMEA